MPVNQHLAKERKETDALINEALRLGIQMPHESGWWWIDDDVRSNVSSVQWELIKSDHEYLTEIGKAGARRLISEQQRKDELWRRHGIQWKLTIAGTIVSWIIGLLGTIIGVLAFLKK